MPKKLRLPRLIDRSRLFLGFLVAAFIPGTIYGMGAALAVVPTEGLLPGVTAVGKFAILFLYFTIPAIVLFGVPFFIIYRRIAWENLVGFILAGAVSALLWMFAFAWIKLGQFPNLHLQDFRPLLLKVAAPGALAGLAFYLTVYVKYHHIKWSFDTMDKKWLWLLLIPALLVQERLLDWANNKIDENSSSLVKAMSSAWQWLYQDLF